MFHNSKFAQLGLISISAIAISACSTPAGTAQRTASPVAQSQQVEAYRLGGGDRVKITVFGQDDLSGEYPIDGTGSISMPLIGQVNVINLTTGQVENKVRDALAGNYLVNPIVSAEVTNYRPYYILGEVGNPGQYPYSSGLTVMEAVASAGGFSYRANKKVVFITPNDSSQESTVTLDSSTVVQPGDTLRIKERLF